MGSVPVYWYGILVATGFLAGLWTASRRCLLDKLPGELVADLGPWLMVGALVGARFLYVVSYWQEDFAGRPFSEVFAIRHGGMVFYGGLIGATATGVGYCLWKKLNLWKVADALAPSISLGQIFGRLGCLANGCCYGRPCDLPWALRYPSDHATAGIPVHPTQLYEAALDLLLYLGLAWVYRRKRFDGQVFALYLLFYALLRSFVELFRGDYTPRHTTGPITPAHWISIVLLVAGSVVYRYRSKYGRPG